MSDLKHHAETQSHIGHKALKWSLCGLAVLLTIAFILALEKG